jgi:hypothetical protein
MEYVTFVQVVRFLETPDSGEKNLNALKTFETNGALEKLHQNVIVSTVLIDRVDVCGKLNRFIRDNVFVKKDRIAFRTTDSHSRGDSFDSRTDR